MTKFKDRIEGDVYAIPMYDNEYYAYVQAIPYGEYAIFDYKSDELITDVSVLQEAKVIARAVCEQTMFESGMCPYIGELSLRDEFKTTSIKYIYNRELKVPFEEKFSLYNPMTGEIKKCTLDEAKGLDAADVWTFEHIRECIYAYYDSDRTSITAFLFAYDLRMWGLLM